MRFGKIVCDPTSEEVSALIGKKFATGGIYSELKERPNECHMGILEGTSVLISGYNGSRYIDVYSNAPFLMKNMDGHGCFCATFIREILEEGES